MGDLFHVGTRKGLFTFRRSASGWGVESVAFLGAPVSMVLRDPRGGQLYAALNHGHFGAKLHRSADDGASWREIPVPAYPKEEPAADPTAAPAGSGEGQGAGPGKGPASLKQVWALEAGAADQPGRLWAGTIPGGLFRSDDHGDTWHLVRSLWDRPERRQWFGGGADEPGIHSVCLDPRDSRRLTVGVSCGGVWHSADGGQSWECRATGMRAAYMPPDQQFLPQVQDPHRVVHCPAAPDVMWAQHHNGIFHTTDAGQSWREVGPVEPSAFGFAVAAHPREAGVAWFVPATSDELRVPVGGKVSVTRTRDGGKSFQSLSRGLPQSHAYDLVYRHALDVDPGGDRLAFGSTTGSLWLSEDAGDSWQTLSTHLPPVYCVRFAA